MKFKLTTNLLYWWPVTITLPDENSPGKWVKQSFTIQFAVMTEERSRALQAEIEALQTDDEKNARKHDALLEVVRDWRDVVDDDKQPVPFSPELLTQALGVVWYRTGIYQAWARSLSGEDARRGN
jgi:hypothetical protein